MTLPGGMKARRISGNEWVLSVGKAFILTRNEEHTREVAAAVQRNRRLGFLPFYEVKIHCDSHCPLEYMLPRTSLLWWQLPIVCY